MSTNPWISSQGQGLFLKVSADRGQERSRRQSNRPGEFQGDFRGQGEKGGPGDRGPMWWMWEEHCNSRRPSSEVESCSNESNPVVMCKHPGSGGSGCSNAVSGTTPQGLPIENGRHESS